MSERFSLKYFKAKICKLKLETGEEAFENSVSKSSLLEMSIKSITDIQFQETSVSTPHNSQAGVPSCNIPMIVKHTHIPHAIRVDTTLDTACSIHHIVKNVKKKHTNHTQSEETPRHTQNKEHNLIVRKQKTRLKKKHSRIRIRLGRKHLRIL